MAERQDNKPRYRQESVLSLAALIVSVISALFTAIVLFFIQIPQDVSEPNVKAEMPPQARITQYEQKSGTYRIRVYIQPTFANVGRSLRAEVIKPYRLYVQTHEGAGGCLRFQLNSVGSWEPAGPTEPLGIAFKYESGASPLVVTYDKPSIAVLAFRPPGETEPESPIHHN